MATALEERPRNWMREAELRAAGGDLENAARLGCKVVSRTPDDPDAFVRTATWLAALSEDDCFKAFAAVDECIVCRMPQGCRGGGPQSPNSVGAVHNRSTLRELSRAGGVGGVGF